jgi:hypothetical protein
MLVGLTVLKLLEITTGTMTVLVGLTALITVLIAELMEITTGINNYQ